MAIQKVWIEEDCTACELCVDTCPNIFKMGDEIAEVKNDADLNANEDCIRESAADCPVEVIKFEE